MDRLIDPLQGQARAAGAQPAPGYAVFEELNTAQPDGLRYATFQREDNLTFVDIALGANLPGPLPQLEAFRRFRANLDERCDERIADEFIEIGSLAYGDD